MRQFRPPAVPLVTVDPYFSVWSMADHLYDDYTRHWTGKVNEMFGMVMIDGVPWQFAGKMKPSASEPDGQVSVMKQDVLEVTPLTTRYEFTGGGIKLKVEFTSPLLPDDLELLSRPVSYVTFTVLSEDSDVHDVKIYFDVTGEWCVNTTDQSIVWGRKNIAGQTQAMYMGTAEQPVLKRAGDDTRIDWGYFHLTCPGLLPTETAIGTYDMRRQFMNNGTLPGEDMPVIPTAVNKCMPVMAAAVSFGRLGTTPVDTFLILAYDDIESIEYFHKRLQAYWRRAGISFEQLLAAAVQDYPCIMEKCRAFDASLVNKAVQAGGEKYADLLSLAYRQAVAAHKLTADEEGKVLFFSKECFSNGCIATVDVSYPSIPLFLLYNTELVKGMMRPIFKYAASSSWPYQFAPHDAGCYPKANGQVYADNKLEGQMPVEECGNMLIMAAAVCRTEGKADFFLESRKLLQEWAEYLLEKGLDPENQLCTDDFAGHLAHNANLSIKAILGVASYSIMCGMLGEAERAEHYQQSAKAMAAEWEARAGEGDHYRLAFDAEGSWSLKYNLVWDHIFELNLFSEQVARKEINWYLGKLNTYGVPLDNRNTYTKSDWLVWAASLAESQEDFESLVKPIWDFLNETPSRVPFSDWYDTESGRQIGFQNRTVQGGLFIKLLMERKS